MPKFRKKPVEVYAEKVETLLRSKPQYGEGVGWFLEAWRNGAIHIKEDTIEIHTLEGLMVAEKTDWIIRGVKGELYPCKPDIFEATYDPVGR